MHIMRDGRIIEVKQEPGYHANEAIRCYGTREMEALAREAGFEVVDHLTRSHLGHTDYEAEAWEPREFVVLRKP